MTRPTPQPPTTRGARTKRRRARGRRSGQEGVALLLSIITVAILGVMVADLAETSSTGFTIAIAGRDSLRAEYVARSGVGLTRLVVAQGPAGALIDRVRWKPSPFSPQPST